MHYTISNIIDAHIVCQLKHILIPEYLQFLRENMFSQLAPYVINNSRITIEYDISTPTTIQPHILSIEELPGITIPEYLGYLEANSSPIPHIDVQTFPDFPTPKIFTSLTPDQTITVHMSVYK